MRSGGHHHGSCFSRWDIIVLVKDVVIGVFDLLLFVVCLVSGGSAGSRGWLGVKNFFSALFSAFGHPVKTFYQFREELKLEVTIIEGLLSDCPQAEFIVGKVVNGIVNLILILAAGHGLVKSSVSLIRGAVEVAELAEQVDTAQAHARTGLRVIKAARVRMSSRPLIFV